MIYKKNICFHCRTQLSIANFNNSIDLCGIPLCFTHQVWLEEQLNYSTIEAILLFLTLRLNDLEIKIEHFDGYKTIDLVIEESKIHIEVDGLQHNLNPQQGLKDLKRTYYSLTEGYLTLRITNPMVIEHLAETTDYIIAIHLERKGTNRIIA